MPPPLASPGSNLDPSFLGGWAKKNSNVVGAVDIHWLYKVINYIIYIYTVIYIYNQLQWDVNNILYNNDGYDSMTYKRACLSLVLYMSIQFN